jgi:4-hydroxybenzoate polyprenyltransferase
MIKFEHTIFALPFAYMGAVLGSMETYGHLPTWAQIGWVTLAMVGARSAAMALNRLIDRHIDAKNPRTSNRAIPAGKLSLPFVWGFIIVSLILLFFAAVQLNRLSVYLVPVAVFLLIFYSYTKRFTWACHFVLGITNAAGPLGGWIAITGSFDATAWVLFLTVAIWVAGFDIIYACQDISFDRKEKIYSIPARFGVRKSLWISSIMHVGTSIGLLALIWMTHLQWWFSIGVIIALVILIYEHSILSPTDLSRLNTAFFTLNGFLSMIVFLFAMVDVLLQIWR